MTYTFGCLCHIVFYFTFDQKITVLYTLLVANNFGLIQLKVMLMITGSVDNICISIKSKYIQIKPFKGQILCFKKRL